MYLAWDRLESPRGQARPAAFEHAIGFRGPTWLSKTITAGVTWEPGRLIFDPGEVTQTIGNQIVVLPDGILVDVLNLIVSSSAYPC